MSQEIQVRESLQINKTIVGNTQFVYSSNPTGWVANWAGANGPSPGLISALTTGTVVDLSKLTPGGMCWMQNLDPTNYVTFGIKSGGTFYPLGELLPGETDRLRLSRILTYGSGGGTAHTNDLVFYANNATCAVRVEAFDA